MTTSHPARLRKRSVTIAGHATSVSLEDAFWQALADIARAHGVSVSGLVADIDRGRDGNVSSAIRVYVLNHGRASFDVTHAQAGGRDGHRDPGCPPTSGITTTETDG